MASDFGQTKSTALMGLHAYSGCDTTSAFRGIGKLKPVKALFQQPKCIPTLQKLGDDWDIYEELMDDLDSFTCSMYRQTAKVSKVNDLRLIRINELCTKQNRLVPSGNVDIGKLPPYRRSLSQHIWRANHRVGTWKRAHIPEPTIPKASQGHGWEEIEDGCMDPLWCDGDVFPRELLDIVQDISQSVDEDHASDADSENDILDDNEHTSESEVESDYESDADD